MSRLIYTSSKLYYNKASLFLVTMFDFCFNGAQPIIVLKKKQRPSLLYSNIYRYMGGKAKERDQWPRRCCRATVGT